MKEKQILEAGLRLSGPNNSTEFSTCCGLAVTRNEYRCPKCSKQCRYIPEGAAS